MPIRRRVQKTSNDQYVITIPKTLVELLSIRKGAVIDFSINDKGEIVLRRAKR
jgi:bifunctional DNA-binding transcriptional regulator/antitoxin component of YhaV-PrlF toxin-antitoxin module